MKNYLLILLLSLLYHSASASDIGPNNSYNLVHNYENQWLIYNSSEKTFLPVSSSDLSQKVHYLIIDLKEYPNTTLLVKANSENNFLFFNGNLESQLKAEKWLEFPVEKLKAKYGNGLLNLSIYGSSNIKDKIVISAFQKTAQLDSLQANIVKNQEKSLINIKTRKGNPLDNIVSFGLVMILGFIGILKTTQPKEFSTYFSPKKLVDFKLKQNVNLLKSGLGTPNLFFILTISLVQVILIFLFSQQFSNFNEVRFFSFVNENPYGNWLSFLIFFFFFLATYILKYFTIFIGGKLFNSDKLIEIHFFKILNVDTIFSILFLTILLICINLGWINSNFNINNLRIILFLYFIIRSVILFFTINTQLGFKNLYLISYLCVVEFLPLLIGFKIFN